MKIGLLTFHSAHNYGAVLQAYATQEIIKELGYKIEVIQYNPDYLIKQRIFPLSKHTPFVIKLKVIAEGLLTFASRLSRKNKFEKFIKNRLQLSPKKYHSLPFKKNEDYDYYIMGSDQIWNIMLTKGFDNIYLGNFSTKLGAKKIAYAASMSHYNLTSLQKKEFSNFLKNFSKISVREKELEELLSSEYNTQSTVVLDPTFLINSEKWSKIAVKPNVSRKYVLLYSIDLRDDAFRIAKRIANEIDAELIELTMSVTRKVFANKYQTVSPEDFVGLFKHAEFVVTSSFHGTAFSVIFNKPFYSIANGSDKDSRQKTILENLGLIERFISRDSSPNVKELDYTLPNTYLEKMRESSVEFLKENLK